MLLTRQEAMSSTELKNMIRLVAKGFTLIELIMVVVIVSILATMATGIIVQPVKSYIDLERRALLVDTAEMALRRMQRDIRQALPGSIRVNATSTAIEILHTVDGGRYRHQTSGVMNIGCSAPGDNILLFGSSDSCFDVIGQLENFSNIILSNDWLVFSGVNAYTANNRVALNSSTTATKIQFSSKNFASGLDTIPYHFFIVDTPITYRCDLNTHQLVRYQGYSITPSQVVPPTSGGTNSLQANKISHCAFTFNSSNNIATLNITLTDTAGEMISISHQVHVENSP